MILILQIIIPFFNNFFIIIIILYNYKYLFIFFLFIIIIGCNTYHNLFRQNKRNIKHILMLLMQIFYKIYWNNLLMQFLLLYSMFIPMNFSTFIVLNAFLKFLWSNKNIFKFALPFLIKFISFIFFSSYIFMLYFFLSCSHYMLTVVVNPSTYILNLHVFIVNVYFFHVY